MKSSRLIRWVFLLVFAVSSVAGCVVTTSPGSTHRHSKSNKHKKHKHKKHKKNKGKKKGKKKGHSKKHRDHR